jgi:hypothetical protein
MGKFGATTDRASAINQRSRVGDRARLCLVSVLRGCPAFDERNKLYLGTNLRTQEEWKLSGSLHLHMCGGA